MNGPLFDHGPQWTLHQAEELVLEQFIDLLDGCEDDDVVRPEMVFQALRAVWHPSFEGEWVAITAGEIRTRVNAARARLAAGEPQ